LAEGELEQQPEKSELPDSVQKWIDVLTAKRKTAEERAAALEAENAELRWRYGIHGFVF
jgi:hypothetical protein